MLADETVHGRIPVKCLCAIEESMILGCKSKQSAHQSQQNVDRLPSSFSVGAEH